MISLLDITVDTPPKQHHEIPRPDKILPYSSKVAKESGVNVLLMLSNSQKLNFNRKVRNMPFMIMMMTRTFLMFRQLYGLTESTGG